MSGLAWLLLNQITLFSPSSTGWRVWCGYCQRDLPGLWQNWGERGRGVEAGRTHFVPWNHSLVLGLAPMYEQGTSFCQLSFVILSLCSHQKSRVHNCCSAGTSWSSSGLSFLCYVVLILYFLAFLLFILFSSGDTTPSQQLTFSCTSWSSQGKDRCWKFPCSHQRRHQVHLSHREFLLK